MTRREAERALVKAALVYADAALHHSDFLEAVRRYRAALAAEPEDDGDSVEVRMLWPTTTTAQQSKKPSCRLMANRGRHSRNSTDD